MRLITSLFWALLFLLPSLAFSQVSRRPIPSSTLEVERKRTTLFGPQMGEKASSDRTQNLKPGDILISPRDRLYLKARRGTETGGGGHVDRDLFYQPMNLAFKVLPVGQSYFYELTEINYEDLKMALRAVTLVPSTEMFRDRLGKEVPFYNDPKTLELKFNTNYWKQISLQEQIKYGIHELMGILEIADPSYTISSKLAEIIMNRLEEKDHFKEPVLILVDHLDPKENPIRFLAQQRRDFAVTSTFMTMDCEKYSKKPHNGACVVVDYAPSRMHPYDARMVWQIDPRWSN